MKPITKNPYWAFPLCAAVAVALLVGWSLLQRDRLRANNVFVVFLLLLPLLAALYSFRSSARASGGRWVVRWLGTSVLGLLAAMAVWFASLTFFPSKASAAYNYAHFTYASYPQGGERRVRPGAQARDETLYTLEGDKVRLSGLWKEQPIVVEFGSVT